MTLKEILKDIDSRLPNTATKEDKARWINNKLNKIWPHIVYKSSDISLVTVEDQEDYTLPAGVKLMHIENVYIYNSDKSDWDEYTYRGPNESSVGYCFFDALSGKIGFYPVPDTAGETIKIVMKKKPVSVAAANLDYEFNDYVDEDFQDIFVYDCISIIAENPPYEDALRSTYFKGKVEEIFDLILEKELRHKLRTGDQKSGNKSSNSWWYRKGSIKTK